MKTSEFYPKQNNQISGNLFIPNTSGIKQADDFFKVKGFQNAQYHRVANYSPPLANVWYPITWDTYVEGDSNIPSSLGDTNTSISFPQRGIYRVQGCIHLTHDGVGNRETVYRIRTLSFKKGETPGVDPGVENRCLQVTRSKAFRAGANETLPFVGTVMAEPGDKIVIQIRTTQTEVILFADAVFDRAVAASVNIARVGGK
jgi:hypothetical protein